MSKRKAAPDLLGDLLSENSTKRVQSKKNREHIDSQPVDKQPTLPNNSHLTKTQRYTQHSHTGSISGSKKKPKVKMTLMLPPDVMNRLARFEMEMRFETGERGHALSKSAIITKSLEILLDEYDVHHMGSRIARDLTS